MNTPRPADRPREKKRTTQTPTRLLALQAIEAILSKKGHDITVMDMRGVSGVADLFILCTGDAELQIKAIADAVSDRLREHFDERPWHLEGYEHLQWVLVDYVDLVVHIFTPEKRAFYSLDRLWGDAPVEHVPDEAPSADVVRLLAEDYVAPTGIGPAAAGS